MGGRAPRVGDGEVLRKIALYPDPVITSTELSELLEMTPQGAYSRLKTLEGSGYVQSKKVGGAARVWWVTQAGREQAADAEFDPDGSQ